MKKIKIEPLSSKELKALEQHEATIRNGKRAFLITGKALAAIRDQCLYRATHKTFAEYCEKQWHMSAKCAYGFIDAFNVFHEMFDTATKNQTSPKSMTHLLAMKGLAVDQMKEAMRIAAEQATAEDREVTAKDLKTARNQIEAAASKGTKDANKGNEPEPESEPLNLPIVEPSDILLWVVEMEKQLQQNKIEEAIKTLNRIHSAIAAWIKTERENAKAA